jgi:hypothetical protein
MSSANRVRRPTAPAGVDLAAQPRILVNVHPGDPPIKPVSVATRSLTGRHWMNNLQSNDN